MFSIKYSFFFLFCHFFRSTTVCKGFSVDLIHIYLSICCILAFDPAKNAIPRWCTGRKWHILMAVMRGNRVGGNWLMKWDEVKKFPWYTHRLTYRKRVTCELHDNYFRWMTINHAISKIEWATEWTLNYYITQSRLKSRQLQFRLETEL